MQMAIGRAPGRHVHHDGLGVVLIDPLWQGVDAGRLNDPVALQVPAQGVAYARVRVDRQDARRVAIRMRRTGGR